jgi:cyclophilin family peptidyl-prolyl cis-trans isomerase
VTLFGTFDLARRHTNLSTRKRGRSAVRAFSGARQLEPLEDRQMLSITLTPSPSSVVGGIATDPAGKTIVVPISGVDSNSLPIQYGTPTSSDPNISVSLVPVTNYVDLNLTFKDSNNTQVTGDIVLALFGNSAPTTVAQIVSLVNQGKYNGETFGYVQDGFVAFAGYNSTGQSQVPQGSTLNDEFNQNLTFTSPGLLAMANAGPDTASSLFFITATDNPGGSTTGGTPVSLVNLPQALNNRFTIFGDLVGGFDVFEKLMTTPGTNGTPTNLVTINSATTITDNHDAVLMITVGHHQPSGH